MELCKSDILKIEEVQEPYVYDLSIKDNHNYFIDCNGPILVHNSSKTFSTIQGLIIIAIKQPKVLISVVAESVPHLKRGVIRDFYTIMGNSFNNKSYNRTDMIYTFDNGSRIEFFSADDHAKLRGARRDYLFINECNNVNYEAFTQLEIRTKKRIFLDFNPTHEFWVHTELLKRDDIYFFTSTYLDNEFLEDEIIKSIEHRKGNTNWWKVYGLGELGNLEGLVFQITIRELPGEAKLIGYGLDFGYTNDPTAFIGVYKMNNELYLKEYIYQRGLTNQDICKDFADLQIKKYDSIIADSAEPKSIEEIRRNNWNIKPVSKGKDSINFGIDIMLQYKLNVDTNSTNLIKEFRNYQWEVSKTGEKTGKPIDDFNHGIDAIRYICMMKLTNKRKRGLVSW